MEYDSDLVTDDNADGIDGIDGIDVADADDLTDDSAIVGARPDPTAPAGESVLEVAAEETGEEIDLDLLDAIEQELADVELALERLGDGTYGRCETCGQVLSEDELEQAPAGRYCRAHLPLRLP